MPTHVFGNKPSPVDTANFDVALKEAAKVTPYYPLVINERTSSPYTLVLADADPNRIVRMNMAGANIVLIPLNSSVAFDLGAIITVEQWGAGITTMKEGDDGVMLRSAHLIGSPASAELRTRYSRGWLQKIGTNEWLAFGDLLMS